MKVQEKKKTDIPVDFYIAYFGLWLAKKTRLTLIFYNQTDKDTYLRC